MRVTAPAASSSPIGANGSASCERTSAINPLRIGGALDQPNQPGLDVIEQLVAHDREVVKVAVLGQREAGAVEMERVDVLKAHGLGAVVDDPAHMGDESCDAELACQVAQVAVEVGDGGDAIRERDARFARTGSHAASPKPPRFSSDISSSVDCLRTRAPSARRGSPRARRPRRGRRRTYHASRHPPAAGPPSGPSGSLPARRLSSRLAPSETFDSGRATSA